MEFVIQITKREPNEKYDEQLKELREASNGRWGGSPELADKLSKYNEVKFLETILTEEEFKAVKKAVIEVMWSRSTSPTPRWGVDEDR